MKIKDGFILREVAGSFIVVAVGDRVKEFNGVINLNETGAFIWKLLSEGKEPEFIENELVKEYDVSKEKANKDVKEFITKLEEGKLLK